MDEGGQSVLAVVLDTNPYVWLRHETCKDDANRLKLSDLLDRICLLVNAHLSMNVSAKVCFITTDAERNRVVWSFDEHPEYISEAEMQTHDSTVGGGRKTHHLARISKVIKGRVLQSIEQVSRQYENSGTSLVSAAMSLALCQVNRVVKSSKGVYDYNSRLCVFSVTPDAPAQYVSMMNTIFAAQKMNVIIDVCRVVEGESPFLQQAAYITKGIYLKFSNPEKLLLSLFFDFLPDNSHRLALKQPQRKCIDFRAACFCHKQVVDIGYVCSVCLSIFCKPVTVCPTCHTSF